MGVFTVTCSDCLGRKIVEQFQERHGDNWVPERGSLELPDYVREEFRDHIAKTHPYLFRRQDIECPKCLGAGEYEIESTPCKIF